VNAVRVGSAVRILSALAVVTVIATGRGEACAICLSAVSVTTGQKLDAADQVVLAVPLPDPTRFRIVEVVKRRGRRQRHYRRTRVWRGRSGSAERQAAHTPA
jgi:hypothetical protein